MLFGTAAISVVPMCTLEACSNNEVALAMISFDSGRDGDEPDRVTHSLAVVGFDAAADVDAQDASDGADTGDAPNGDARDD
jgi:hypothetical protein